ncbi:hypothetical protein ACWC10_06420 [Streptomyces sp. NPDC001595]|uniref:hypothetical protein n=1 Tax=Streptomyces sp. NPDC001532 TaxID=3154520 RepID=UPI00331F4855
MQQGTRNTQINYFGGRGHDADLHESRLADYLTAAADASTEHPYPAALPGRAPSLDDVYVHQRLGNMAVNGLPLENGAVERILNGHQTCVVLAGAGGGKSSLLRTLLAVGVRRQLDGAHDGPVPVVVPAAALEGRSLSKALSLAVRLELPGLVDTIPLELFQAPPRPHAHWLVLVDELDEIADPTRRRKVLRALMSIEQDQRTPQPQHSRKKKERTRYRFVIATRPLPDDELSVLGPEIPRYELERFQLTDLKDVARRWFDAHGMAEPSHQAHLFVGDLNRSRLAGLARIPLTASLLCQLRAAAPEQPLPGVRGDIYAEFARLLHKRQYHPAEPGSPRELPAGFERYGKTAVDRAEHTLSRLPYLIDHLAAQRRDGSRLSAVEIVEAHPDAQPPPYPVPEDVWRDFLATALSHSGFLTFHAGDHVFAHQTLMEYCAARHTTRSRRARPVRRILAQWHGADPSYVGFVIDTASPDVRRKALAKLRRLAVRNGLEGCLFAAEIARIGTNLPVDLLERVVRGLAGVARSRRRTDDERTRAVIALTRLPEPGFRESLHRLVQSGGLNGTALVAAIAELLELGDPQVRDMLHNLAVSEAQYSAQRLWAADRLGDLQDPRLPDVLYRLAVSGRGDDADRSAAAMRLAAWRDPRAADAHHAIATCASVDAVYRVTSATELETLGDHRLPDVLFALAMDQGVHRHSQARQWAARRLVEDDDPRSAQLLLALAHDRGLGESFRRWAAGELSDRGHPGLPDVLYSLAGDTGLDGHARVRAAWDLARTGDGRGRELLRTLALTGPGHLVSGDFWDEGSRARAASALASLNREDASDVLHGLARDESRDLLDRHFSVRQLADVADVCAADALQRLATDAGLHSSVRVEAAFELADMSDPRGTDALHTLVLDSTLEMNVRAFVLLRLCGQDDERVPKLLRDLATWTTLDGVCRARAVAALTERTEAEVGDLLFDLTADTDAAESTRTLAATALMDQEDARAPYRLHALAADPALRPASREAAMKALGRSHLPHARRLLCDLASSPSLESALRYAAARTLARHSAPEATALLVALALDVDALPRDRAAAAYNLTERGDPLGADLLCTLARDGTLDDEHRFEAADDLTDLHDPRGTDLLHDLALDPGLGSFTRRSAVRKLARLDDPRLPALLHTLAEDATLDDFSRLTVVRRLALSGGPAEVALLRRFAEAPGLAAEVRAEAAKALHSCLPAIESEERPALPAPPSDGS